MDTKQPEALRLADAMERFSKSSHRWTDKQPIHIAVASVLRSLHAENQALRAGYDAAGLEIESLKAQLEAVRAHHLRAQLEIHSLQAQEDAHACPHRIADARNAIVQSGSLCVDCGALFSAAAPQPSAQAQPVAVLCWCQVCRPITFADSRMVLCPDCGNKRCPKANDHRNACTGSNLPGQPGSAYPLHNIAAAQQGAPDAS